MSTRFLDLMFKHKKATATALPYAPLCNCNLLTPTGPHPDGWPVFSGKTVQIAKRRILGGNCLFKNCLSMISWYIAGRFDSFKTKRQIGKAGWSTTLTVYWQLVNVVFWKNTMFNCCGWTKYSPLDAKPSLLVNPSSNDKWIKVWNMFFFCKKNDYTHSKGCLIMQKYGIIYHIKTYIIYITLYNYNIWYINHLWTLMLYIPSFTNFQTLAIMKISVTFQRTQDGCFAWQKFVRTKGLVYVPTFNHTNQPNVGDIYIYHTWRVWG